MRKQLVLFEFEQLETKFAAVWGLLTSEQREAATRLLAELMARGVVGAKAERSAADGKREADE